MLKLQAIVKAGPKRDRSLFGIQLEIEIEGEPQLEQKDIINYVNSPDAANNNKTFHSELFLPFSDRLIAFRCFAKHFQLQHETPAMNATLMNGNALWKIEENSPDLI